MTPSRANRYTWGKTDVVITAEKAVSSPAKDQSWIGVDLDRTLAQYDTQPGSSGIGVCLMTEFAQLLAAALRVPVEKFDPDQERDESGKWTDTGGGGTGSESDGGGSVQIELSSPLTKLEVGVMVDYKMGHSEFINPYLYEGKVLPGGKLVFRGSRYEMTRGPKDEAADLDKALAKSTLKEDTTLYRGMHFLAEKWRRPSYSWGEGRAPTKTFQADPDPFKDSVGKVITSPAYTSTSVEESRARSFTKGPLENFPGAKKEPVYNRYLLQISVPKGTHALDMDVVGSGVGVLTSHEREVLLGRNTKLYINSIHKDPSGVHIVKARVLP